MRNIIIIIIIIALAVFFLNRGGSENVEVNENVENTNESSVEMEVSGTEMDEEIENAPEGNLAAGTYEEYSPEKVSAYADKNVVLFFKADWCPSCRALDSDIKESLSEIPENLVILDVDYDQYTELKQKYGVTTQHTLVQVDAEGNLIQKWAGGNRLETVINKI